jgi:ribosome modulation factor
MAKRKKKTPEERAAERAYREDLTRRLQEAIDYYKARIAEKRAASEGR